MGTWTKIEWNKSRFQPFVTDDGEIKSKALNEAKENARDFKRPCPRCKKSKGVDAFGLRRMAYKDGEGKKHVKIGRQSYCSPCRVEMGKIARAKAAKAAPKKAAPKKAAPKKAAPKKAARKIEAVPAAPTA